MKKLAISAFALLIGMQISDAATITGDATALIEETIGVNQTQQMNFGTVTPITGTSGIVRLSPSGTRSSGSLNTYGTSSQGQFQITAGPLTQLTINISDGTLSSGDNSMTIDTFTTDSNPASNTTNVSGTVTLNVGANLNVGADQPSGTYNGTYVVTISY